MDDAMSEPAWAAPGRRAVILQAAAAAAFLPSVALAQQSRSLDDDGFLELSRAATGHADLNAATGRRMFALFRDSDPGFADRAAALWQLHRQALTAEQLLEAASTQGLRETMLSLVAGWYTGTVGLGENARMVSYAGALMYRPVADALAIPTYCSGGPAWWTQAPPPVGVSAPTPKPVAPPPPLPTPAETPKSAQP
jgi:hypothetical protein